MDYRPALRQRTGVGEYVHQLATALAAVLPPGDALTVFSSSFKDRLAGDAVPGARRVDARIPVSLLNFAWHRLEWPPADWLAGPVDVTHSMHPLMLPSRAAASLVTIHDLYFLDRPEHTSAEIRRDYPALTADHARRADGIIVPSEYTASQVRARLGVPSERVTVCSPGAPPWTARDEPPPGGPILFVGSADPRKNIGGLLRAYARLREREPNAPPLVMAGRETERIVPLEPEPDIPPQPDPDRIRGLGYVTDQQRLDLYRSASMLIMPSFDEGFGLPALEALTLGLPVIAANRGALPEVIGEAGILVDPDDDEAIANAMHTVLSEPEVRMRLRHAGIARARAYSWEGSARRLHAAYGAAVARRRGRA